MPAGTRRAIAMFTDFFAAADLEATARRTGFVQRTAKITGTLLLALVPVGTGREGQTTLAHLAAKGTPWCQPGAVSPEAMPQRMHQKQHNAALTFWITLFLLIGLILGLASFIAYSYLPHTDSAARLDAPVAAPQPSLRLQGTPLATIVQGQELHVHGDNFNAGAPIIFLLDGTTTINDTTGRQLAVVASDQGSFDVVMSTSTWSVGTRVILAQDNKDGA